VPASDARDGLETRHVADEEIISSNDFGVPTSDETV
jgi:hypothetical protein